MRGASALERSLAAAPTAQVDVIVAWEPVIATDKGPPAARTRRILSDDRVSQYWDEQLLLSQELLRVGRAHPKEVPEAAALPPDAVAWDLVLVVEPGTRWSEAFPLPSWWRGPVVDAEADLTRRLRALESR